MGYNIQIVGHGRIVVRFETWEASVSAAAEAFILLPSEKKRPRRTPGRAAAQIF
jgi:hypothetical protein